MTKEQEKEFQKDTNIFLELAKEKLTTDFYDAVYCLIKSKNYKSAWLCWYSFYKYLGIQLTEEENNIVQRWYYWFGR
jgi:hypothetical protein